MIMGFFANTLWTWAFPILALVFLVIAAWRFLGGDSRYGITKGRVAQGAVFLLLGLVCIAGYFFSATHGVVPVNRKALVVNVATGQVVDGVRDSGLTTLPLWTGRVHTFHGGTDEQVFTPSVQGGYEVLVTTCFFIDLSEVDWLDQYSRYATGYDGLLGVWKNQLAQYVAFAIKEYKPQQLTEDRNEVAEGIETQVRPWFRSEKIPLSRVYLANWDFTNEKVGEAYDQTIIAQTQQIVAEAEYDAAETRRKTAEYEAETANLVVTSRTEVLKEALDELEIDSEEWVIQYLTIQWLREVDPASLRSIVLNVGGQQVQPTVPVTE
jgi:hypothetical protein